jgi:hypothetical protein
MAFPIATATAAVRAIAVTMLILCAQGAHADTKPTRHDFHALHGYRPQGGWVPNSATAIAVARALGVAAYGDESIEMREPLVAELHGDTWVVIGNLPEKFNGGPLLIRLSRIDGRVLFLEIMGK